MRDQRTVFRAVWSAVEGRQRALNGCGVMRMKSDGKRILRSSFCGIGITAISVNGDGAAGWAAVSQASSRTKHMRWEHIRRSKMQNQSTRNASNSSSHWHDASKLKEHPDEGQGDFFSIQQEDGSKARAAPEQLPPRFILHSNHSLPAGRTPAKAHFKAAIARQRQRCSEVEAKTIEGTPFDHWCSRAGALDDLARAFELMPFPRHYVEDLREFEERTLRPHGVELQSQLLLCVALMHPSWIHKGSSIARWVTETDLPRAQRENISPSLFEASSILSDGNTRLEYLGDSVIKVALSEELTFRSGLTGARLKDIAILRAKLEHNHLFGIVALKRWQLARVMLAAAPEFKYMRALEERAKGTIDWGTRSEQLLAASDHRAKGYVQFAANCLEAVVGAVSLDLGPAVAMRFVQKALMPELYATLASDHWRSLHGDTWNPVSDLQMHALGVWKSLPEYRILKETTVFGQPHYHIGVFCMVGNEERLLGQGDGSSLALARRASATVALRTLSGDFIGPAHARTHTHTHSLTAAAATTTSAPRVMKERLTREQLERMSCEEVCEWLRLLGMSVETLQVVASEQVPGAQLAGMGVDEMMADLAMSKLQAKRLVLYADLA